MDAEKLNSTELSFEFISYRNQLAEDEDLCKVLTEGCTIGSHGISKNAIVCPNERSFKQAKQGVLAIIRLLYLRSNDHEQVYIINNLGRWDLILKKNDKLSSYNIDVRNLLIFINDVNWSNLSLNQHVALCVLFHASHPYYLS